MWPVGGPREVAAAVGRDACGSGDVVVGEGHVVVAEHFPGDRSGAKDDARFGTEPEAHDGAMDASEVGEPAVKVGVEEGEVAEDRKASGTRREVRPSLPETKEAEDGGKEGGDGEGDQCLSFAVMAVEDVNKIHLRTLQLKSQRIEAGNLRTLLNIVALQNG